MGCPSGKPVSYTRLSQVLSSVGGKPVPTTSGYICFYVPEDELATQVSYSIRIILTYDEPQIIEDEYGKIEVIPCWKWMLGIE